jgi:SWI/SNF-related matrix-associated actin-dependent regulator of chromatin subfamily D
MLACCCVQARDLRVAQNAQNREFEAEQPSSVFRERWVEDAVMRYLNRKMAAGR